MPVDSLTNEEKISIIQSHIKNIEYNKFNAELNLIEENATTSPNANIVSASNETIEKANLQIAALEAEIAALEE